MRNLMRKLAIATSAVLSLCMVCSSGCSTSSEKAELAGDSDYPALMTDGSYSLDFSVYEWSYMDKRSNMSNSVECYYVTDVVYCANPTTPTHQCLNIYVPTAYINEDGTINTENVVNGWTALTAPIIYQNSCGSYYGYAPYKIMAGKDNGTAYGWYYEYLAQGYVVIFAGERGINITDDDMHVLGVAPVGLADLKAGIRYIRANSDLIPGDTEKIISQGMSAGGAMSSLIGVSGNSSLFDSELEAMGAIMDQRDDVFADQAYCPIIDLDHASLAYEWTYKSDKLGNTDGDFSNMTGMDYDNYTTALSEAMALKYAEYINSLGLKDENGKALTLNSDGTQGGTLYEWLISHYETAYEKWMSEGNTDVSELYSWLTYDADTGTASLVASDGYSSALESLINSDYLYRKKGALSFDDFNKSGDNRVFGVANALDGSDESKKHYTVDMPEIIESLKDEFPEEYELYYYDYYNDVTDADVLSKIRMYSPYAFVLDNETDIAKYFRINVGTEDSDTSPMVSAVFAVLLQNAGVDVDYNLVWGFGHIDADSPTDFIEWVESICR